MKDIRFLPGEFVIWKGEIYRIKSYQNEYALFAVKDTGLNHPLSRIPRPDVEDYYTQFAFCDYKNIRYQANQIRLDECYFSSLHEQKLLHQPLSAINEIWIKQFHFDVQHHARLATKIETIWLNPICQEKPSQQKFYIEKMANGNLMTSHLEEELSLKKTTELLKIYYSDRIQINITEMAFWDTYIQNFQIDHHVFRMTLDYGIIDISPKTQNGNSYIQEIVKYFNKALNSPLF